MPTPLNQKNAYIFSKISSTLCIIYVLAIFTGILIHYFFTKDLYTLKYSLLLPKTWFVSILSMIISCGLWKRLAWAWWLGVILASIQLFLIFRFLIRISSGVQFIFPLFFTLLFVLFIIIMLLPQTRRELS